MTTGKTIRSDQISCSVLCNSLRPQELQHTRRPPCPSPTPGVHSNSRPSSQWCHPAISSWVDAFSSCPQSLPASESFPMSIQDWFALGWTGLIASQSKGLSRVFSNTTVQKHQVLVLSFLYSQLSHSYMTTGKTIALTRWTFVSKVMFVFFNILSRLA